MRKLLITILLILLLVLAYFTIFDGISIGDLHVLGASGIVKLNDNLTIKIEDTNRKIVTDMKAKEEELSKEVDTLLKNKESYYKLANVSTESEISKASTEETYDREYLWVRVGRHARTEGVNIKMEEKTGNVGDNSIKNLDFTVVGQYFAIMDFISALEDDSELNFRIDGFHMVPSAGNTLQATFSVIGVRINQENLVAGASTSSSSDTTANTPSTEQ